MDKYIIFGTGSVAKEHYERVVKEYGDKCVECFIDSMLAKESFCGKPVIKPDELQKLNVNEYVYLLGTFTSKVSMINELKKQGVSEDRILIHRDYGSNSFEKYVKKVNRILIYPSTNEEKVIQSIDEQFKYLVPNVKNLKKPPIMTSEAKIECQCISLEKNLGEDKFDLVLVWDKSRLLDDEIKECENIYCIDPYYFRMINIRILLRLNLLLEEEKEKYELTSKNNYSRFLEIHKDAISYVFGAGPSCKTGANIKTDENSIRIVCNNFVDNLELIKKIKPNVYVLSEEDSMSKGYIRMIKKIRDYVLENNCILVTPNILAAVLVKRYPEISKNLVRVGFDIDRINFPTEQNMKVYRKAYNVITCLAVPIASSLSNEIYITGCDGIDMENHVFDGGTWKHDKDLDKNASFEFSIRVNEENWDKEYYLKHISYFEEVLGYGESLGKKYISHGKSYIPALVKRS